MPDAILFDFDGVIVDSEPIHMKGFAEVLARRDIPLTREEYYAKYIGYDDRDCFAHVLADHGRPVDRDEIVRMIGEKSDLVREILSGSVQPLPGAIELMQSARGRGWGVAICSGSLRREIELAGAAVGALQYVQVLVAADDVTRGKPDPQGYQLAMELLAERLGRKVNPAATYVIEDSPAGILAGKAAGCRVIGVTNSYAPQALSSADAVVTSLTEVNLAQLA